ncbi:MAG TPA: FHA domain-containing protein [Thermoanaerobaculia bacterium]|nr:FHA domain-containing protein [Thermoanaerobaculia bacterium]
MARQIRFGAFSLDRESRQLTRGGKRVPLQPKHFDLLTLLLDHHPAAVSKDEIYRVLWPDVVVEEANVHNLVSELRRLLKDPEHSWIRTVHRFGYAFAGIPDAVSAWELRVGERRFPLHHGENILGRDEQADISIDAPGVSRRHARIVVEPETVTIEDLGSKNGTFVGKARVDERVTVGDGDRILIAHVAATLAKIRSRAATITE